MRESSKLSIKAQTENIRKTLETLINPIDNIDSMGEENLPELPGKLPIQNFTEIKASASRTAKKTIDSLMKFYLSEDIISKSEYLMAKKHIDEISLSSLIYQLNAGEIAITRIMEGLELGECSPRMFEVLALLQKTNLDVIKAQTSFLQFSEETTKKLSNEFTVMNGIEAKNDTKEENIHKGTKNLLELINKYNVEAAETAEVDE